MADLVRDKAIIGGRWSGSSDGAVFAVRDPATGSVLCEVPDCSSADANEAIGAAHAAHVSFSESTVEAGYSPRSVAS